ncbi:MAG: hypothetical protein H6Q82_1765 [Deltaproteobacteria bacterium]|nr:hypothetical protein [Deltaproteobacteria bacterium]
MLTADRLALRIQEAIPAMMDMRSRLLPDFNTLPPAILVAILFPIELFYSRCSSEPRNSQRAGAHLMSCNDGRFGSNLLRDRRWAMYTSISCKELGMECNFIIEGETGEKAIELLMRHVQTEHTDDWFEIEEIYQAACSVAKSKAA